MTTGYNFDKTKGLPRRGETKMIRAGYPGKYKAFYGIYGLSTPGMWSEKTETFQSITEADAAVEKFLNYKYTPVSFGA